MWCYWVHILTAIQIDLEQQFPLIGLDEYSIPTRWTNHPWLIMYTGVQSTWCVPMEFPMGSHEVPHVFLKMFRKHYTFISYGLPQLELSCACVYIYMKEGSLFCFVVMRSTELRFFRSCSWCLWKALDEEGCMGLVPWPLNLQCKSSWILNDFFTEN